MRRLGRRAESLPSKLGMASIAQDPASKRNDKGKYQDLYSLGKSPDNSKLAWLEIRNESGILTPARLHGLNLNGRS